MKRLKKLLAIVVMVMLVATLCVPAMAAENRSIKINADSFPNHTFAAYQIFTGTLSSGVISDVQWGYAVDTTKVGGLVTALQAADFSTGAASALSALAATSTAEDFAEAFDAITDADDARVLGHVLYGWDGLKDSEALKNATTNTSSPYYINGTDASTSLGDGYYLVKDVTTFSTSVDESKDVRSSAFLKIVGSTTTELTFKGQVPTADKQSGLTDGTYAEHNNLSDALKVKPGDTVYYQLKGTLASNFADYDTYYYEFIDTPENVEIDADTVKLYVKKAGATNLTEANIDGTKVVKSVASNGVLTVVIADVNDILASGSTTSKIAVAAGDELYVRYAATVTNDALTEGIDNNLSIKFSNDPFSTSKGTTGPEPEYGATKYGVVVKYDGADNKCLAGANFSLYTAQTGGTAVTLVADTNGYHVKSAEDGSASGVTAFDSTEGQIYITGLNPNETYYLGENTPATGYNSLSSRVALTMIDADPTGTNSLVSATIDSTTKVYTTTTDVTGIANNKGSELPETGGIGTKIFIILGSVAVLGAGIFLVTNKRMSKEEI